MLSHSGQQGDSEEEFCAETWSVCASRTWAGQGQCYFSNCLPSHPHLVFTLPGNPLPLSVVGTAACFKQIESAKVMGWMSLLR